MRSNNNVTNVLLWVAQVLLALLFLFAGVAKLTMPAQVLAQQSGLPAWFMHFIAVAELAGALGLVLPGLLRIRRDLTSIAALGLVIIMAGATTITALTQGVGPAAVPLIVGIVLGAVVGGRRSWVSFPARGALTGSLARG